MPEKDNLWATPEGRARYIKMIAEGRAQAEQLAEAARAAIALYVQSPNTDYEKAALAAVGQCSSFEGSEYRLLTVLPLIEFAPPEIFWPAFLEALSFCDATWYYRGEILRAMKDAGSSLTFLQPGRGSSSTRCRHRYRCSGAARLLGSVALHGVRIAA
jgi:hypothetical protein